MERVSRLLQKDDSRDSERSSTPDDGAYVRGILERDKESAAVRSTFRAPEGQRIHANQQDGMSRAMNVHLPEEVMGEQVPWSSLGKTFERKATFSKNDTFTPLREISCHLRHLLRARDQRKAVFLHALSGQEPEEHPEGRIASTGNLFAQHQSFTKSSG